MEYLEDDDFVLWGQFDVNYDHIDYDDIPKKKYMKRKVLQPATLVLAPVPVMQNETNIPKETLIGCCINVIMQHEKLKKRYYKIIELYTMISPS